MPDAIKFRCKACDKKIAVKAEYAGKKAKCPGCKEPLRVPSPRPKRSETGVPVSVGSQSGSPSSRSGSSISLSALAAMEAGADAEIKQLSSKAAYQPANERIEGGKDCPSCGASLKPNSVICVHCGHNFDSGKKLKTKKDSKIGKAMSAVTEPDQSAEEKPWKTLLAAAVFIIMSMAVAFYDYDPGEDAEEILDVILGWFYDTIGQYPTAGIIFVIGAIFAAQGIRVLMRR